jgi:hypothetical protein
LLEEGSHKRALAVLKEFLDSDGERLIEDPLKRALLQRDLWLVFNWLERPHSSFAEPRLKAEEAQAAEEQLRQPLAAVIDRLVLSRKQIQELPNNYAAAVASGKFARAFDQDHPGKPYLPADLFKPDGPWVCVGRTDGRTAPQHLRDDNNAFTNSVFLVFLRLPNGRAATADYLKRVVSFDQPLLLRNPQKGARRRFISNPKLPQFPQGTELALVRRVLLIDSSHCVVASPLTESIQLRIMRRKIPDATQQLLDDAFSGASARNARVASWQSFQEFQLSRMQLFSEQAGGLRAVRSHERDFKTGFRAHAFDRFESPLRPDQSFRDVSRITILANCFACHSLPGIYSFNSLQDFRSGIIRDGDKLRPFPLAEMPVSVATHATVKWKENSPYWIALRTLLIK